MLWTFRKDNEQDIFHLANRDVSVFLITMKFVVKLDAILVCKNIGRRLEADSMLPHIDFILLIVPFDGAILKYGLHILIIPPIFAIHNAR